MVVFACERCGAVLTTQVSRVALPDHADQTYSHELLPAFLEPGTYAVNPEPSGPPWRLWDEVGTEEVEARGIYAPVYSLSYGPAGKIGIAPGDVRGTVLIPERCDGYCYGVDGRDGPNLACAECGRAVATRIDDCSLWQVVWLAPHAVRPVSVDGPADRVIAWEALREQYPDLPPVEQRGWWSPQWEATVAVALAHLLSLSGGMRVVVPDGPVATVFRRALDALLPPGPPERHLTLAGPSLPAVATDIALVPRHPQTGETWPCNAKAVVPLAANAWLHMAFHDDRRLTPATAGMLEEVRRDDPPPLLPAMPFRPDLDVFLATLARLPATREPWLRQIYDHVKAHRYDFPYF
ncbi:hypothetical protein [Sinosporangium siamense]|uniref:Uncharacterized protein n=1 Tax=Sinosporangium siamense TaxID=1367973 RepID=A0A919RCH7_9ACTN|nr:hypothetical protein [Sinosporangium siamense]GII91162.1 hypothetical protein Ssi02_13930 [Sinosporangium siamense]